MGGASSAPGKPCIYRRCSPVCLLSPEEADNAAEIVAKQANHKVLWNYKKANNIRDQLIKDFNVRINNTQQ